MRGVGALTRAGRRRRAARAVPDGPLRRFLEVPPPAPGTPIDEIPMLAVDVETTGLDPRRDRVVAVGFVPVDGDRIVLAGAGSMLLRPGPGDDDDDGVGQSATVHGLTDDVVAAGEGSGRVLDRLLAALTGRVLLAHHSAIETGFIREACRREYGVRPPLESIDTLGLQRRVLGAGLDAAFTGQAAPDGLRLWDARERYGLPRYRAHDPLADALACAELYLAQVAELRERGAHTLRDLRTP